jgi:hypothetical protein
MLGNQKSPRRGDVDERVNGLFFTKRDVFLTRMLHETGQQRRTFCRSVPFAVPGVQSFAQVFETPSE